MTEYPAKPQVAPQTGRTPPSPNKGEVAWLSGVTTSELRQMVEFSAGHLYLFVVKHLEKKVRDIETNLGDNLLYAKEPYLIAVQQGQIKGIREFKKIFNAVEVEYNRRIAKEEALNHSER